MTIRFERDGAIGTIVLANPPFNRLDLRFAEALRAAVHQASVSDIRVLVIRSEGPHFSFGGEVREWPGKDVNWFRTFVADVNASYRAIEMLKIPTMAVVQGIATQDTEHPERKAVVAEIFSSERNDRYINELISRLSIEPSVTAVSWEKMR